MSPLWLTGWMFACVPLPEAADTDTAPPVPDTPSIVGFDLDCDVDAGRWTLTAHTDAWTGGAISYWTVDGAYIEEHRVNAIAYAEDGTREDFELELSIVSDWREQATGSSTAFTCAERPQVLFRLDDLDGNSNVDCRVYGDPAFWDDLPTPDCTNVWEGRP